MPLIIRTGSRLPKRLTVRMRTAVACSVMLLWTASSSAVSDPTWLTWTPPPECPPASHIVERVRSWLGASLPEDGSLAVETELHWDGVRWEVAVQVSVDGHSGRREVAVSDCREAADFVSVAVVLAVDPERAQSLELSSVDAFDPSSPTSPEDDEHADTGQSGRGSAEEGTSPTAADREGTGKSSEVPPDTSTVRLRPEVATKAKSGRRDLRRRSAIAARAPSLERANGPGVALRPHLTVAVWGNWGVLPGPRLGPGLTAGATIGRWIVSGGALWLPPANHEIEEADANVDFSLLAGRLEAAYVFGGARLRLGPLVALQGGVIRAYQSARPEGPVNEPWLSVAAGLAADVKVHSLLHIVFGLELNVPFTQPIFVLSDDTRIYRVGPSGNVSLGLRILFNQE